MSSRACALLACVVLGANALSGCEEHKPSVARDGGSSEPSPNASILPAPLATGLEGVPKGPDAGAHGPRDAGRGADAGDEPAPEPHTIRVDQILPSDTPRDSTGVTLTARFRWLDAPPARLPEANLEAIQRARDASGFDLSIDIAGARTRVSLSSHAFTLPVGSELHARDDLYGFALLWGNQNTYTVLAPGTLRALFGERRADVLPQVYPKQKPLAPGNWLGFPSEQSELSTLTGRLVLEQIKAPPMPGGSSLSGAPLCRLLLELIAAAPNNPACHADLLPLKAEYVWPSGAHFLFETTRLTRRSDLEPSSLAMPPAGADFRQSELPPAPANLLLKESELATLRNKAIQRSERAEPTAPKSGLLISNHLDGVRYLLLDGAPVARVGPGTDLIVPALKAGQYAVLTRDFFGSDDAQTKTVEVPGRVSVGEDR